MKHMLVAKDGGIYRDRDGDPIRSHDLSELRSRALAEGLQDWQIVPDDIPWIAQVAADAEGCACSTSIYCRRHDQASTTKAEGTK